MQTVQALILFLVLYQTSLNHITQRDDKKGHSGGIPSGMSSLCLQSTAHCPQVSASSVQLELLSQQTLKQLLKIHGSSFQNLTLSITFLLLCSCLAILSLLVSILVFKLSYPILLLSFLFFVSCQNFLRFHYN